MKIKRGDTVLILSGRDKGKKGKILRSFPVLKKIVVENVNIKKKSVRPKKAQEKGQIVEFPSPFNVSNVKLVCPKCSQATRVGYILKDKIKRRICKKCRLEI